MRGFKSLRNVENQFQGFLNGSRACLHPIGRRIALHKLKDKEVYSAGFILSMDGRNIRMIQGRQQFCFALEPRHAVRISGEFLG